MTNSFYYSTQTFGGGCWCGNICQIFSKTVTLWGLVSSDHSVGDRSDPGSDLDSGWAVPGEAILSLIWMCPLHWFKWTVAHSLTHVWEISGVFLQHVARTACFVFLGRPRPLRPATLPHNPDIWRRWKIVVTCTRQLALARNSCSSFSIAVGLLAASPTSFLLLFLSILQGRPVPGNATVVPCFLLLMTEFTGFKKPFDTF